MPPSSPLAAVTHEEKYYEKQEAREEGARNKLKEQVMKKLRKGKSAEEIESQ